MQSKAATPDEYINSLPDDKRDAVAELRKIILKNLQKGFEEVMSYGMIGYVVPHSLYPQGYHCDPKLPLPYMNLAAQKNHIALYHMGLYAKPELTKWLQDEYPKHTKAKFEMGKGCLRFKKPDQIPFQLLGELVARISVKDYISGYEEARNRS